MLKTLSVSPNLMVPNIQETLEFYLSILGFSLEFAVTHSKDVHIKVEADAHYDFAIVKNGDVRIMFQTKESLQEEITTFDSLAPHASATFYFSVENIEDLHKDIESKTHIERNLHLTWYGMKEFYLRDNNGYILFFGEKSAETEKPD